MAHKNTSNMSPMKPSPRSVIRTLRAPAGSRHRRSRGTLPYPEARLSFKNLFAKHGFENLSDEQLNLFTKFYLLLMAEQNEQNFTRLLTVEDVAVKHFIDCLMVLKLVPDLQFPLMDMGTGPGFPGIPLKFMFPDQKIILAEGVQKRVQFLKETREQLQLKNLDIIGRNINPQFVYPVHGVITRAVEDVRNTLSNVVNSVQVGGKVYLMKGPNVDPEIEMANATWSKIYQLEKDHAYEIPHTTHQRRLLVYKKIAIYKKEEKKGTH